MYTYMCTIIFMKKKQLEKQLNGYGWWKYKEGSNHELWTNGKLKTTVPRHREINELTAKGILKLAKEHKKS